MRGLTGTEITTPSGRHLRLDIRLGAGAFGEVYRVRDLGTGSTFAVKVLRPDAAQDELMMRTLLNEAELATRVSHDNIVRVYEAGEDDELGLYLVMEYLPDGNLEALLEERKERNEVVAVDEATAMMVQIAEGARAVNTHLIHRDIKPDNILLDGTRLKIGDFGISKVVLERTRSRSFKGMGPIRYMAPEAWGGDTNTTAIDVYSVGIVFHEILTHRHPLPEPKGDVDPYVAWRDAHLYGVPSRVRDLRAEVPSGVSQLIGRMLGKRAQGRPAWNEVLDILARTGGNASGGTAEALVERALARHRQVEARKLADQKEAEVVLSREKLYETSFRTTVGVLDEVVDEFNSQFQSGRIEKQDFGRELLYELPHAPNLEVALFNRRDTDIAVDGGTVAGGGLVSVRGGVSANLIWLTADGDPYGRWLGCLVRPSPLVDGRAFQRRGFTAPPVFPFGFQTESEYYEEIRWAGGGMHIFKYELWPELRKLFFEILDTAFKG